VGGAKAWHSPGEIGVARQICENALVHDERNSKS
jgi:hypothetical protein